MTEQEARNESDKLIGTIVANRYEILARLGQGAMGTVYKARHTSIGRFFALKTLNAHIASDERSLKRFEVEARAMSVLTHPNLIQISDYGKTEDGIPFFVMEYLDGITLSERLAKSGPLPVEHAQQIFAQIADALEQAHSKSIIHRDLKPSNIMLIGENFDFPKIVDLGIAKLVSQGLGEDAHQITMTGEIFGSPLYMSPEQCQGLEVDARSDIYSLGCVLYQALSGRPPLKGKSPVQTIYQHMHERPTRITSLSEELSDLIFECLEKRPELRPPSMAALRDRLRNTGGRKPKSTQPLDSTMRAQSPKPQDVAAAAQDQDAVRADNSSASASSASGPASKTNKTALIIGVCLAIVSVTILTGGGAIMMMANRNDEQQHPSRNQQPDNQFANQQHTDAVMKQMLDRESALFERENPGAPQELAVVGVYTAQRPSELIEDRDSEGPLIKPQPVDLLVRPKDRPITLVLLSYFPVNWRVKAMPGANIKQVIASGYFEQTVTGINCPVETHCSIKGNAITQDDRAVHTANIFVTHNPDANRKKVFRAIDKLTKELVGAKSEVARFKGRYYGTKFEI